MFNIEKVYSNKSKKLNVLVHSNHNGEKFLLPYVAKGGRGREGERERGREGEREGGREGERERGR